MMGIDRLINAFKQLNQTSETKSFFNKMRPVAPKRKKCDQVRKAAPKDVQKKVKIISTPKGSKLGRKLMDEMTTC